MNIFRYPEREAWAEILARPTKEANSLNAIVSDVLARVKEDGDEAIREFEAKFDHADLDAIQVTEEEMDEAEALVSPELREALEVAHKNIHKFHAAQKFESKKIEVINGVTCWQKQVPIESVGLYIPGGTAPLFSTVLMLATPAKIAGCKNIVLCSPPNSECKLHPAILVAARIAGVEQIYKIGGVQAIGAMAYGTESVPKVSKIFGPGNQYVMCAKQLVSLSDTAIDMPAGPSEVAVLADETSDASFVAADLLSQAEHGLDSQVLLITTSEKLIDAVEKEVAWQLTVLPRKEIATKALENSKIILVENKEQMMEMSNAYAPEHLIIETSDYEELQEKVVNAGSVFLGSFTPESAGDYASGTNHTLPTNGYARAYTGVNLDSFCRKITFQHLSEDGIKSIANAVELMAAGEKLEAHRNAMALRRMKVEK